MWHVKESKSDSELQKIIDLRYRILREPWQQSRISATDHLEDSSVNGFITDEQGNVIACGRLQENEGNTGQIRFMAVAERYRGQGLGKLIIGFLEAQAIKKGLNSIQLQARENALEFYSHQGYRNLGASFLLWDQIQHYLMEKKL